MKKKKEKEQLPVEELDLKDQEQTAEPTEEEQPETEAPEERMEKDIDLFRALFPDVSGDQIPQEVWELVEAGESLAASYALYAVKKYREEEKVRRVNEENDKKAPPPIEGGGSDGEYFSPEAVKRMSRSEVRKNYDKILSSMDKWN